MFLFIVIEIRTCSESLNANAGGRANLESIRYLC